MSANPSPARRPPSARRPRDDAADAPEEGWIWGTHAAKAALANPKRRILKAYASRNAARELPAREGVAIDIVEPKALDKLLPPGAVHQGVALRAKPLAPIRLDQLAKPTSGVLVMLDQVTDPQNVGAVARSAAAFGARGLVLQDRKAPPFFGGCAKAAVGAVERLDHARVVNLSRALNELALAGWTTIGLDGAADRSLDAALTDAGPGIVLVLGAEGKGLRPSVAEACQTLGSIPIAENVESLNVSNAAAIALYAAARTLQR